MVTIYSLDILLFLFETSLFQKQTKQLVIDLLDKYLSKHLLCGWHALSWGYKDEYDTDFIHQNQSF